VLECALQRCARIADGHERRTLLWRLVAMLQDRSSCGAIGKACCGRVWAALAAEYSGSGHLDRAVECQVLERECYVQLERFLLPRAPPAGPEEGGEPEVPPAPAWA
jgi:hypothetical protein